MIKPSFKKGEYIICNDILTPSMYGQIYKVLGLKNQNNLEKSAGEQILYILNKEAKNIEGWYNFRFRKLSKLEYILLEQKGE